MKLQSLVIALLLLPLSAIAQTDAYECTMGDLVRRVVIERSGPAPVPCAVAYYKDSEAPGERQELWNAQNDAAYCGARATEFVSQLEGWGWQCTSSGAQADAARNEQD